MLIRLRELDVLVLLKELQGRDGVFENDTIVLRLSFVSNSTISNNEGFGLDYTLGYDSGTLRYPTKKHRSALRSTHQVSGTLYRETRGLASLKRKPAEERCKCFLS